MFWLPQKRDAKNCTNELKINQTLNETRPLELSKKYTD